MVRYEVVEVFGGIVFDGVEFENFEVVFFEDECFFEGGVFVVLCEWVVKVDVFIVVCEFC